MKRKFSLWFTLTILLVICIGLIAYNTLVTYSFNLQDETTKLQNGGLFVGISVLLILIAIVGLMRLVIKEHKSRIRVEGLLNEKYDELNRVNELTSKSNLLLDGLRQINDSLMGNDNVDQMVDNCLEAITTYLKVPAAVCYLFDSNSGELLQAGAIALTSEMKKSIKLGEGITGAAAKRKNITVIHDIPQDYWHISSGSGTARPDTLLEFPLWKGNELIGIIEIGCFLKETDMAVELLNEMSANIAMGLSSIKLLALAQEQRDALEVQQEELRQINSELAVQAEELIASEEEMKVQGEELAKINIELEEKTEALELARAEMQKRAEDLELTGKYKSEFLANMSHELRTPLNSILILTALMRENKEKNLSTKQQDNLDIVYKSGTDLLKLINDILDLSKIEAGKANFQFEEVSITEIANDMQNLFTAIAGDKQIHYEVNYDQLALRHLVTDRQRLGQVLKNLLSNAFKFTPQAGSVWLDFNSVDGQIAISVKDTGVGIPPDKQQMIFGAFQQADGATTRRYGGTGLGLSISKELVQKLGGTIRLESTTGKGSTFTVYFPESKSTEIQPTKIHSVSSAEFLPTRTIIEQQTAIKDDREHLIPQERTILIIEDDVNFARAVNDFAIQRGFKTIIALRGDEGLHYAQKYRPAAIILDLALPVLSGQHILKALKSDPNLAGIPVHVISAFDGSDLDVNNVASYTQKPVSKPDLEYTFQSIETYIKQHYRKVIVLCDEQSSLINQFEKASEKSISGLIYELSNHRSETFEMVRSGKANCLVIDCSGQVLDEVSTLKEFREIAPGPLHIITYVDRDISAKETDELKAYADTIISPSMQKDNRLFDEIELFLEKVSGQDTSLFSKPIDELTGGNLAGRTILVADDDMRNIFALSALLEANEMKVIIAEHGKEAITLLNEHPSIDLVLMDIMMPEMDGYEAMTLIRQQEQFAQLPIIALTAKAMMGDRKKCIEAGASDYIAKPIDNIKLLSVLRVWLNKN